MPAPAPSTSSTTTPSRSARPLGRCWPGHRSCIPCIRRRTTRGRSGRTGFCIWRIALVASLRSPERLLEPDLAFAATIHHGIELETFAEGAVKDDFLLFVGRMSPKKGAHLAVTAATRLGRRLIVATKMTDPVEMSYFEESVAPLLTEGVTVLPDVDRASLASLYRDAACLLAPFQWSEPFGLTMVEAMARGTPSWPCAPGPHRRSSSMA